MTTNTAHKSWSIHIRDQHFPLFIRSQWLVRLSRFGRGYTRHVTNATADHRGNLWVNVSEAKAHHILDVQLLVHQVYMDKLSFRRSLLYSHLEMCRKAVKSVVCVYLERVSQKMDTFDFSCAVPWLYTHLPEVTKSEMQNSLVSRWQKSEKSPRAVVIKEMGKKCNNRR